MNLGENFYISLLPKALLMTVGILFIAGIIFTILEYLLPLNAPRPHWKPSHFSYRKFVLNFSVIAAGNLFNDYISYRAVEIIRGDHFLAIFDISGFSIWAQVLIFIIPMDLFHYFEHRFLGHGPTWRFHLLHHSEVEVDWCAVFHPMDFLLTVASVIPVFFIFKINPAVLVPLIYIQTAQSMFAHSNIFLPVGIFKYVFVTPQLHNSHHQTENGSKINYGVIFSLWDTIAGTFLDSGPAGQLHEHGLKNGPHKKGILFELVAPFYLSPDKLANTTKPLKDD